jgi:hypothetical protein
MKRPKISYESHVVFNKNDMARFRLKHLWRPVALLVGKSMEQKSRGQRHLAYDDPGVGHFSYP